MAAFDERFTPFGVRPRARSHREGALNWLFLPGGPGIGSESLHELVDAAAVPGTTWMVEHPLSIAIGAAVTARWQRSPSHWVCLRPTQ